MVRVSVLPIVRRRTARGLYLFVGHWQPMSSKLIRRLTSVRLDLLEQIQISVTAGYENVADTCMWKRLLSSVSSLFVQIEEPLVLMHFETNLSKQMKGIFCFVVVDLHQGIKWSSIKQEHSQSVLLQLIVTCRQVWLAVRFIQSNCHITLLITYVNRGVGYTLGFPWGLQSTTFPRQMALDVYRIGFEIPVRRHM